MFTLKNVSYKNILSIDNIEIKGQAITTLFGESGSGKSTFLKLLNRIHTNDSGDITYKNQEISTLDPIQLRREVIMLPQEPTIFEGTVRDNLQIGLEFSEKEKKEDHELMKLLESLKVKKQLDDDGKELSGGEKQRVALGRIMLLDAPVYLVDEPTSALDESTETTIMDLFINFIKDNDKTAVMVTHSKEVAQKYSDEVIYMKNLMVGGATHGRND